MSEENPVSGTHRRSSTLVQQVMDSLSRRIEQGDFCPGDKLPTESGLMLEHHVSRTVIREAISRLQAAGLVETRHGIGTFVLTPPILRPRLDFSTVATIDNVLAMLEFRICMDTEAAGLAALRRNEAQLGAMRDALEDMETGLSQGNPSIEADFRFHFLIAQATNNPVFEDFSTVATIDNVLAMLEFRICMDTEAAGLAALRRNEAQLGAMRDALEDMETGLSQGNPSIEADFRFHFLIAQATNNPVFEDFYQYFGTTMIPRTRLDTSYYLPGRGPQFLLSVNREHKRILDGIARQDQKAARNAMYKHLYNSRERLQQVSKANEA